jgi:GTPase SAR1 family protein
VVEISEGRSLAAKYNVPFFETSALTGENINEVFDSVASEIRIKILDTDDYKESEKKN